MSTLFINTRFTLARLSPVNKLQRYLLSRKRQSNLARITKEKLYTLQIQEEKLKKQLHQLNTTWKQSQKNVDTEIAKLAKKNNGSSQAKTTDKNFVQFIETLEHTQDIEIRIGAISSVVEKIDGIELVKSGKQVQSNIQSILTYRAILDNYLAKLQTEMVYWKTQLSLEEIKTEIEGINAN